MSANSYVDSTTPIGIPSDLKPGVSGKATNVRHAIIAATALAAFLMYLDRACLGWILESDSFKRDIVLAPEDKEWLKASFFWAYALAQVPAGWLAERFGKRLLMTLMILSWSAFTALTSFSDGLTMLLFARIGCGLAEAGAYPIAGSLLSRWANLNWRGMASSIVSLGGRLGFALAPLITSFIIFGSGDWRYAGWIYGAAGIFAAAIFWFVFRETPEAHPACNAQEVAHLNAGRPPVTSSLKRTGFPWMAVLTDTSLWLMCAVQFLTNFGWAFVINSMPTYLKDVRHLSDQMNGTISTLTLVIGFFGLLLGGVITDACMRRFGVRMGRLLPMALTRFISAGCFILCLWAENPWALAVCLGMMTFSTDAGLPAMWAWAQDVGGKQVAPIMGWANMWGNFGAALQPTLLFYVNQNFDTNKDWHEAFLVSAGAFALSGLLSLGINAAKPVVKE